MSRPAPPATTPHRRSRFAIRFGNHLDSATLELDDQSNIISYEEYFPYGGTSYQAVTSQTDLPRRYRFTGKERDSESDLYYHGARYYAPWLGRWTACDPLGIGEGMNVYLYAAAAPVCLVDRNGMQASNAHPEDTDIYQTWPKDDADKLGDPEQYKEKSSKKSSHDAGPSLWDRIKGAINAGVNAISKALKTIGTAIKDAVSTVGRVIKDAASAVVEGVKKAASAVGDWVKHTASAIGDWVKRTASAVADWAKSTASSVGKWFKQTATSVGNWFKKAAATVANWTKHAATWVADKVQRGVSAAGKWIKTNIPLAWNKTKTAVVKAAKATGSALATAGLWTLDKIGKIWASPNTIIALLIGVVWLFKGAKVSLQGNAITFNKVDFGNHRAFTMGNVVFNPGPDAATDRAPTYDGTGTEPVGQHEEGHTYQYQLLGPFFFFAYLFAGGAFGPKSPFEHGADRFGTTGKGWMPY